jgi:hypothetical protein
MILFVFISGLIADRAVGAALKEIFPLRISM